MRCRTKLFYSILYMRSCETKVIYLETYPCSESACVCVCREPLGVLVYFAGGSFMIYLA